MNELRIPWYKYIPTHSTANVRLTFCNLEKKDTVYTYAFSCNLDSKYVQKMFICTC